MGLSIQDAKKLGIWDKLSKEEREKIKESQKKSPVRRSKGGRNLQLELYEAIRAQIPSAEWEKENLIPGRQFRVDIFIPPRLAVECDGRMAHAINHDGFHKGLERQNKFVKAGFLVLRYSALQILRGLDPIVEEVVEVHESLNK